MRLLHTSDWHLGQTLHDFERDYEHDRFLGWLLDTLEAEQIEGLLIAGDIFDNANPSAAAQKQFYGFLTAAKRRVPHLNIVIIAGNHDSSGRLEAPAPLFAAFDATAVGSITRHANGNIDLDRLVTPLRNHAGEIAAWTLAIPFLRPGDVPLVETEGDRYLKGVELLYRQALDQALSRREPGQAIIALGHCHMTDGQLSKESERPIIGGAEALPVEIFDPVIAYAALGHLHRAQKVGGQERVRYSGSPLPMSFTEINYPHQVIRIDLDGEAVREITPIPVNGGKRFVDLLRIPDQPAPVEEVLERLAAFNFPEQPSDKLYPYLQIQIQSDVLDLTLRTRIESILKGKPVRRFVINRTKQATREYAASMLQSIDEIKRWQPENVFKEIYRREYQQEPPDELLAAFAELQLAAYEEAS